MSKPYLEIELMGEIIYLLPEKAIYRPLSQQLILSDLHLGKTTHFRKYGIPLPANSYLRDREKLTFLLNEWKPMSVLILGDLFHSTHNSEWMWFQSFLNSYPRVQFILVEGNHDILHENEYQIANLRTAEFVLEDRFIFSHYPLEQNRRINFCGHIHPGIRLEGYARQSAKLPCFYFNGTNFILPAFGNLTGLYILEREDDCEYYIVTENRVIKL